MNTTLQQSRPSKNTCKTAGEGHTDRDHNVDKDTIKAMVMWWWFAVKDYNAMFT